MHLRLASNLMYGLSLLYKQKVDRMLNDIGSVNSRLSASNFYSGWNDTRVQPAKASSGPVYLKDDINFSVDFQMDALDFIGQADSIKNLDRILRIRQNDNERNFISGIPPLLVTADERDRLFSEFMELSTLSLQPDPIADDHVSFALDLDADNHREVPDHSFLDGIDFDQDYISTAAQVEDISKSVSGNEPHFSTTLDATRAVVCLKPSTVKRRKIVFDDPTSLGGMVVVPRNVLLQSEKPYRSLAETTATISKTLPPFVNLCMRMIFGKENTSLISTVHLPLRWRQLQHDQASGLLNEADIELGRNVHSRRQSSKFGLQAGRGEEEEDLFAFGAFDLNLDWEPPVHISDNEENTVAQSVSQFHDYIMEMVGDDGITFDQLVPSCLDGVPGTTKRIAASAFASILELSTRNQVALHSIASFAPCHPLQIEILLSSTSAH